MMQYRILQVLLLTCLLLPAIAADDILIADFEGTDFGDWAVEGDAFSDGPANKDRKTTYQITGFRGNGLASSYKGRSLKPKGTLTSPEFTIQRDYINLLVDHITQSNTKIGFEPVAKAIKITDNLLLFPVKKSGTARRIMITVDGILIHDLKACLAMNKDEVAWWGYLDMSDMIGKTATIKFEEKIGGSVRDMIECGAEPRCLLPKYDEKYRPQFHFSQLQGWNNDPNGMVYYNGRYHLFWQCNPLGTGWGNMYWGHASSPDTVNWIEHKRALRCGAGKGIPLDKRHPAMATGACFSGSGNVDHNNATGLNIGDRKTLLLFNSDMNAGVAAFYSHDGITFKRWMKQYPLGITGRDAKFVYHEPTKEWVAVSCLMNKEHGRHFPIFTSPDLQNWTLTQNFENVHECPEFVELPVDGDKNKKRWVLMEASSEYFIGQFNGKQFVPDSRKKQVTMIPRACYAGQCFSNPPDGRAV